MSCSQILNMQNFFCEKHGKSVADGTVGRTNQFVHCAITTKKENILNSETLAKFCTDHLEISAQNCECKYYQRYFLHSSNWQAREYRGQNSCYHSKNPYIVSGV